MQPGRLAGLRRARACCADRSMIPESFRGEGMLGCYVPRQLVAALSWGDRGGFVAGCRVENSSRSSRPWWRALLALSLVAVAMASGPSSPAGADDPEPPQDLQVSHSVVASVDRTYLWDIDKVADETTVQADPVSGIAAFDYTVTATPDGWTDSGRVSSGTISVHNPNQSIAISGVTVITSGSGAVCSVPYGGWNRTVGAGATVELTFSCQYPGPPTVEPTVTTTVTWQPTFGTPTTSASDSTTIAAADWSITPVNDVVDVIDDRTDPANPVSLGAATWNAAGTPTEFSYSLDLDGTPDSCVGFTNTAWIAQTNQEARETVEVCMTPVPVVDLQVSHSVVASVDRTYLWDIDKVADETTVQADPVSGIAAFDYTVTATPDGWTDSGRVSSGTISVHNPNQSIAISGVTVITSGSGAVCSVPYGGWNRTVGAGATVELTFSCQYPGPPTVEPTVTTTVTWQPTFGTPTTSASDSTTIAAADWSITPVNDVVDVIDDRTDPANPVSLGAATWNAAGTPTEFSYSLDLDGTPDSCVGFTNTAWIAQTNQEARETVEVCTGSLRLEKSAGSAELLPDGNWSVSYEIEVFNDSDFAASYVLTDTLDFGVGVTPIAASWALEGTAQTGTWDDPANITTATLADGRALGGAASHRYTVTVVAEVAEEVIGTDPALCSGADGTDGGGFLNVATLIASGVRSSSAACTAPQPSPWTLSVAAIPPSGSTADPGDTITFTVTAAPTAALVPVGVAVRHDLSQVLAHGTVSGDIVASTGTTSWDGDVLVWDIGTLGETATLTFSVTLAGDAWATTLASTVSGTGSSQPTCEECSTTHTTPVKPGPVDPGPTDPGTPDPTDPEPGPAPTPTIPDPGPAPTPTIPDPGPAPTPSIPDPINPPTPGAPPVTAPGPVPPGQGVQGGSGNAAGAVGGEQTGQVPPASGRSLPRTGDDFYGLVGIGLALVAAGASVVIGASRRLRS